MSEGNERVARGAATVLVVDDSTATRRILRGILEAEGYDVKEAGDGHAAVEACRAEPPDVMLLDVDMPGMDGPTALEAIKSDANLVDIPVLFLTARTSGSDLAAGLELGAQDYLKKPCEPAELLARVSVALRRRVKEETLEFVAREADRLGNIDTLTGLANRRQLELRADELRRFGEPTTVGFVVMDIDHFKEINDGEGGHLVGDTILRLVAARLRATLHDDELLVRWGGDEFVALAPGLGPEPTAALAQRMRTVVADAPFPIGDGRTISATISVGCASTTLTSLDDVMQAADEALYRAKGAGRNQVATAS